MFQHFNISCHFRAHYIALIFLIACSFPLYMANLPQIKTLVIILFLLVILIFFKRYVFFIYIFIFFAVLINFIYQAERYQNNRLEFQYAKQQFLINTKIIDFPEISTKKDQVVTSLNLRLISNVYDENGTTILYKNNLLKINCYRCEEVFLLGEKWQFNAKLKPPRGVASWGAFDYEKYAFANGIVATGYLVGKPIKKITEQRSTLHKLRQKINQILDETINQQESSLLDKNRSRTDNLALLKALIVGDRTQLKAQHWSLFRQTGTSHLMSISGLHITLVFFLVSALIRMILSALLTFLPTTISRLLMEYCFYRFNLQNSSMLCGLIMAVLYAYIAGFSLPTQRAVLMLSIMCSAYFFMKKLNLLESLSAAVIVLLLFSPLSTLHSGFWLSVLAVTMIAVLLKGRETKWLLQFRMALAMIPLTLLFFSDVPLVSPIANSLLIPIIAMLVLPLALLMTVLSFCVEFFFIDIEFASYLLGWGWQIVNILVDLVWYLLRLFSEWQIWVSAYFSSSIPSSNIAIILTVFVVCIVLMWRLLFARNLLILPILAFLLVAPEKRLREGEFALTTLDVGQGLAIIIETSHHYVAFDTGIAFSESDSAEGIIIPYLKQGNSKPLSHIVISHADNDHIGGLSTLHKFSRDTPILINQTYSVDMPKKYVHNTVINRNLISVCYEKEWQIDGVSFQILPTPKNKEEQLIDLKRNNRSCVMKVSSRNGSALLPGDIERVAEHYLATNFPEKITADVLIAAHHGSRSSSTPVFLNAVRPDLSIISAAYFSPYGHPHSVVLKRLQKYSKNVLTTAHSGSVKINFLKGGIQEREYRALHPRFWYSERQN